MSDLFLPAGELWGVPPLLPSHPMLGPVIGDLAACSPGAAMLRLGRRARLIGQAGAVRDLLALPCYRAHLARLGEHDPAFFLSHRHFLARGLSGSDRMSAALHHYRHEDRGFDEGYAAAVHQGAGLALWQARVVGIGYAIVLTPSQDVGYEGGLSLAFQVEGERVALLSFSTVPRAILGAPLPGEIPGAPVPGEIRGAPVPGEIRGAPVPGDIQGAPVPGDIQGAPVPGDIPGTPVPGEIKGAPVPGEIKGAPVPGDVLLLTRKQMTQNLFYQPAFAHAFDRTTPAHLLMGAVAGLALAQGHRDLFAIAPEAHPSFREAMAARLRAAYGQFWLAQGGRQVSRLGYALPLPLHAASDDRLTGRHRKRALARRAHAQAVCHSARQVLSGHLRAA